MYCHLFSVHSVVVYIASHLRCHGDAAEEEDDADAERRREAHELVETERRELVDEPGHHRLNQHHLHNTRVYVYKPRIPTHRR